MYVLRPDGVIEFMPRGERFALANTLIGNQNMVRDMLTLANEMLALREKQANGGRVGGLVVSETKAYAARENGKKGGYPKGFARRRRCTCGSLLMCKIHESSASDRS